MEMEGDCLGNRLWEWRETVETTTYGNRKTLFKQKHVKQDILYNKN